MGPDVRVDAMGLRAKIGGQLHVEEMHGKLALAGQMKVEEGHFPWRRRPGSIRRSTCSIPSNFPVEAATRVDQALDMLYSFEFD